MALSLGGNKFSHLGGWEGQRFSTAACMHFADILELQNFPRVLSNCNQSEL